MIADITGFQYQIFGERVIDIQVPLLDVGYVVIHVDPGYRRLATGSDEIHDRRQVIQRELLVRLLVHGKNRVTGTNVGRIDGQADPGAGGAALVEYSVRSAHHRVLLGQIGETDARREI